MEWLQSAEAVLVALGFSHITLVSVILVVLLPVSFLYAFGRGLNILQGRLVKNLFALILVVVIAVVEVYNWMPVRLQSTLFLISLGFFMYVVFWQKFYNRISSRMNKVIGEDGEPEENDNGFPKKKKPNKK